MIGTITTTNLEKTILPLTSSGMSSHFGKVGGDRTNIQMVSRCRSGKDLSLNVTLCNAFLVVTNTMALRAPS